MLIKLKTSNQHFNTYYQDNPLLIQFIILEFLNTFHLAAKIQMSTNKCFESDQALIEASFLLSHYFHQLLGTFSEHRSHSKGLKGPLTKLRHYAFHFSKNGREEIHQILYNSTHQLWISALHNLEIFNTLMHGHQKKEKILIIKRNLAYFFSRVNSISKHIPRVLCTFHDNENVMFFLFRKKELLAEIYGPNFIKKIFKASLKKSGVKQDVIQLLMQRYIKRGFGHLVSSINFS